MHSLQSLVDSANSNDAALQAKYLARMAKMKAWHWGKLYHHQDQMERHAPYIRKIDAFCCQCLYSCSRDPHLLKNPNNSRHNLHTHKDFGVHTPACLLYTSDAADDLLCVDLGG